MFNYNYSKWFVMSNFSLQFCPTLIHENIIPFPHSTEYCRKMSGIFAIFHCNWNIVATFLSNIAKYFIATLQFQRSKIFLKINKYLILLEIL